jgi:hypothetical protein
MALPHLRDHPKFRRLVHQLKMPEVYVQAHLEAMWRPGYVAGNPVLGDPTDVELAAEWAFSGRAAGEWFRAVLACKWIDEIEPGLFQIHDLHANAPGYVGRRWNRERERQKRKICEQCGGQYHSAEKHARFCSDLCRVAHWRCDNVKRSETNGRVTVTRCNAPATPTPTPERKNPPLPPQGGGDGFNAFWQEYPKKVDKADARRAWNRLHPSAVLCGEIMAGLRRWKQSEQWSKDGGQFIPYAQKFLNKRRWEVAPAETPVEVGESPADIDAKVRARREREARQRAEAQAGRGGAR